MRKPIVNFYFSKFKDEKCIGLIVTESDDRDEFKKDLEKKYRLHVDYGYPFVFDINKKFSYQVIVEFCNERPHIEEIHIYTFKTSKYTNEDSKYVFKYVKNIIFDYVSAYDFVFILKTNPQIEYVNCNIGEFNNENVLVSCFQKLIKLKSFRYIGKLDLILNNKKMKNIKKYDELIKIFIQKNKYYTTDSELCGSQEKEILKNIDFLDIDDCNTLVFDDLPTDIKYLKIDIYEKEIEYYLKNLKCLKHLEINFKLDIPDEILKNIEVFYEGYRVDIDTLKKMKCLKKLNLRFIDHDNNLPIRELLSLNIDQLSFKWSEPKDILMFMIYEGAYYDGLHVHIFKPKQLLNFKSFDNHYDLSFNYK